MARGSGRWGSEPVAAKPAAPAASGSSNVAKHKDFRVNRRSPTFMASSGVRKCPPRPSRRRHDAARTSPWRGQKWRKCEMNDCGQESQPVKPNNYEAGVRIEIRRSLLAPTESIE